MVATSAQPGEAKMRNIGHVFVLVLAATVLPLWAADPPKGSGSASGSVVKPPDPKAVGDQFVTTSVLIGTLNDLNQEAKTFSLKVTTKNQVPNQQAQADLLRARQDLANAAGI